MIGRVRHTLSWMWYWTGLSVGMVVYRWVCVTLGPALSLVGPPHLATVNGLVQPESYIRRAGPEVPKTPNHTNKKTAKSLTYVNLGIASLKATAEVPSGP